MKRLSFIEICFSLGTSDFFGLNFYGAGLVSNNENPGMEPSFDNDKALTGSGDPDWIK